MELQLEKKSVVITGGASNIGRSIVLGFAEERAKITLVDIDVIQAEIVASEAIKLGAESVTVVECDVTNGKNVDKMFSEVVSHNGTVDVLVNNVGYDELKYFTQTNPEFWRKIIEINFILVSFK